MLPPLTTPKTKVNIGLTVDFIVTEYPVTQLLILFAPGDVVIFPLGQAVQLVAPVTEE